MSDEEGATPFQVACEVTPGEVAPRWGKEALGTWRAWAQTPVGTLSPIQPVRVCARVEPSSKPERSGVYVGQLLSFGPSGKARWGKAKVANRTREIRPSGMKTGARGNVAHGGTVNPPRNRKGGDGNPPPKSARAPALSRPPKRIRGSGRP
jgi:hypothetical protein